MKTKKLYVSGLIISLLTFGCGGKSDTISSALSGALPSGGSSGGSSSSPSLPSVRPADGTYVWRSIICFTSSSVIRSTYSLGSGSVTESLNITGGNFNWSDSSTSCTVNSSGTLSYGSQTQSGTGGVGNVTLNQTNQIVTGSSPCSQTATFVKDNSSYPNLTMMSFSMTSTSSSTPSSSSYTILYDTNFISLYTVLKPVGYSSDSCYLIYVK